MHRREATYTGPVSEPLSESIQHYLREIYKLHSENGQASVTALARKLDVSNASASAMVKKLDALDLAHHERYRGVTLTDSGERVALEDDVRVLEEDGRPVDARPFTRKEILPLLERWFFNR